MATFRDLQRLLVKFGYSPARLEICGRLLRDAGRLPSTRRTPNETAIDESMVAAFLLAYQGSARAVRALIRLRVVEGLRSDPTDETGCGLLWSVRDLLTDPGDLIELRVSRVGARARIVCTGWQITEFSRSGKPSKRERHEVEGVVSGHVLRQLSSLLADKIPIVPLPEEAEDVE